MRASGAVEDAAIDDGVAADVVAAVVANESIRIAVELIGANGVHASDECGLVSGCAHGVCKGGDAGVEDVGVGPDLVVVRVAGGEHGHARGDVTKGLCWSVWM